MFKKILAFTSMVLLCGSCLTFTGCQKEKEKPEDITHEPGYGRGEIVISAFWPPMKGFATEEQFKYLVEGGIDLLEWGSDPIFTDVETIKETIRLCNENNIKITICDSNFNDIVNKSDSEIKELVNKYKNEKCVVGYYILDEPSNANPYGRIARIMSKEHKGSIAQLNMLPMGALADARGHAEDWINAAGRENLRYLSFDQYPFGLAEGSVPQMFPNMNLVREVGLKYEVDTALYIQSIGVIGGFRRPTVSETRYHTSAALAYGYKNLKYFTWMSPVERSEEFTIAIISPEGKKTDTFEGIAQINRDIKKVSKILGNLDAVEIYHNGRNDAATTMLAKDWYVESTDNSDFLVSLMVDRNDGTNYLMVVNKDYKKDVTLSLKLNDISDIVDVTSGSDVDVKIKSNTIKCDLVAGGFRLYRLNEGVSLQEKTNISADSNLALDKPVYSVSSIGQNGYYNYKVVDGQRIPTKLSKGWRYEGGAEEEIYITIDLKREVEVNRVDLYPGGINDFAFAFFPKAFTILYSTDGKEFNKALEVKYDENMATSYKFDTVKARYIKIRIDELVSFGEIHYAEIGEIEIYKDDGTVPEYEKPFVKDNTLLPEYNVALNKKTKVSSTLEVPEWGWKKDFLNDGQIDVTASHSGWTTQTKKHIDDAFANEWAMIDLGGTFKIDTVVLYPRQNSFLYFPKHLTIEVSSDSKKWTIVYEHKESGKINPSELILKFTEIDANYVRVVSKEMTQDESSPDGYLFQLAEFMVFKTDRKEKEESTIKNKALNCPTFVSSSSEFTQWGWSQNHINDGITEQSESHSGFTTQTGINKDDPKKAEWIVFMLGKKTNVSKVVIYPTNGEKYFPKGIKIEVSVDGKTFTKVADYVETDITKKARTITFETVEAVVLRVTTTEMRKDGSSPDGYLLQVAEIEIY